MENINTLVFGHKNPDTDSICSSIVHSILDEKNGWKTKPVRLGKINKETQFVLNYLNLEAPELIEKVEVGQDVLLVDHNEFNQSVDGIEKANILGVTDHHKIANFQTSTPLYFTAKPYGCTATILFEEFKRLGHEIGKAEAILMLSAIISDTLLLKSPTTTKHDEIALEELASIANVNAQEYGLEMLKAGTSLDDLPVEELLLDAKSFSKNGINFVIAQVNTVSYDDVLKRQDEIENAINNVIAKDNLNLFVFAITDILNCNSKIIALGKDVHIVEEAFNVKLENNVAFLEGVTSRKKQLTPFIDECI